MGHVHESGKSAIYAARLHPHADTTTANLETFLAKHAHDIERIKGVLADDTGKLRYVQYVPGSPVDTSEEAPTGSVPELLVYCRDEETRSSAEAIFGHRVDTDDLSRTDAKSLMSRVSDDTPESVLISHVRYLLSLYPAEIAAVEEAVPPADFGDADLAYQIVKNRRLPDWIRRETYALWIGKRLESLRLMSSMGESVTRTPPGTYVFRRLGSNLAWHAGQPERFGLSENICKVIWDSRPGYALAE